jgi:hypothetical protein
MAEWDPRPLIRVVNALQVLGEERAGAAVAEYIRVTSPVLDDGQRLGGTDGKLFGLGDVLFRTQNPANSWYELQVSADVPLLTRTPSGGFSGSFNIVSVQVGWRREAISGTREPVSAPRLR